MSYSPSAIKQLIYLSHSTTFPTTFTGASDSEWTNNGVILRAYDIDFGELKVATVDDTAVQSRFHGRPPKIRTLRGGMEPMSVKFKMHLGGGSSTTTPTPLTTLLGLVMGGIKSPTAITDAAEAGTTTTSIAATAHGQSAGQASLYGVRGDGQGDGRVGVAKTISSADAYALWMALPGAMDATDAIKNGHTLWVDFNTQNYLSFLLLGHYEGSGATDDPDIINCTGCSGTVAFGGLAPGETPYAEFTFRVANWRSEPYASTRALDLTTAPSGDDPVSDQALGELTIGDAAATTRTTIEGGKVEIDPGMAIVPIQYRGGMNGVSGWAKVPSPAGPTFKVTRYWGDMPGLFSDFTGETAKQIMFQMGCTAQATAAFDYQNALLDEDPHRDPLDEMTAIGLVFHGDSGSATDESTADYRLQDAPLRVHLL